MAGELKTSQFRFTTTADDDFVIGNPSNVAAHTTKALVFQTTQIPGYGANPSFSCVWNGTSWEFNLDKADGSGAIPLTGMAYVAANNAFTGNNTFAGTSTFTGTSTFRGYTRIANSTGTILTTLLPGAATASVTLPASNGTLVLTSDSHLLPNYTTDNNNQVLTVVTGIPVWRAESGLGGNTTATLSSTSTLATVGSSYVVTATLTSSEVAAYTGSTITFTDNNIVKAVVGVVGNTATYSVSSATLGTHSYKATFSGDFVHTPCVSSALLVTVGVSSVTPTMALVRTGGSGTGSDPAGTSLTFTITVSGLSGIPTGTVIFYDGTTPMGPAQTLAGGISSITTNSLVAGSHLISATYTPSGTVYSITSSSAISQTITGIGALGSTTTLTRTVGTASEPFGTSITFHVVVAKTGGGGVTPTGTIIFKDGATTISTGTLILTGGTFDWSISSLVVTSHSITAVYSGDSTYNTSTSNIVTQDITAPVGGHTPTVTMLVGGGGGTDYSGSIELSANIVGTGYSTNPPLGLVTWYRVTGPADPTIILMLASQETVVSDPGDGLQDVFATANHLYTFSGSALPGTVYYIMATYSDYDTYYDTTNSAIYTEHVVTAPAFVTTSLACNSLSPGAVAYVAAGSVVNIHASVTGNYAQPTGTVTFHAQRYNHDGGTWTDLGNIGTAVAIVGSTASTTYTCPTADYIYISAIYNGDGVYTAQPYDISQLPIFFQEDPNISVTSSNNPASPSSLVTYRITMSSSTSSTQWHPATMGGYVSLNISGGSTGTYSTMGYLNSSGWADFANVNVGTLTSSVYATWEPINGGNDIFKGKNSSPITQSVGGGGGGGGITTHTYLTRNGSSSAGPVTDSQHTSITFEAIVDNASATGSVVFMNNGTTPLHTTTPLASGAVATWNAPWDTVGTYVVTAVYSGDGTYSGSTSSAITEIISASGAGSFYRPSTYTNGYVYGTTEGGTLNEVNVWDFDTVPTLDMTTAAYVYANNGFSARKYQITYSGFGTGTVSGSVYAYISASATGWIEGAYALTAPHAVMLVEYSTDAGSTWTTIITVENSGTDYTTPGNEIGTITGPALSNIALANLRVRISCTGATSGSLHADTVAYCASDCYVYDIVLK